MRASHFDLKGLWSRSLELLDGRALVASAFADLSTQPPPVHVLALGKAAGPMAQGALDVLGDAVGRVVVVAGTAEGAPKQAVVHIGDHPLPGPASFAAGRALLASAEQIRKEGGKALVLISGGGSALAEVPAEGLSEEDLRLAHRALVESGAPIESMNRIRGRLSAIKSGGLARALGEALAWEGVLADVPKGDPAAVASGPCRSYVREPSSAKDPVDRRLLATPRSFGELVSELFAKESAAPVRLRREVVSGVGVETLTAEVMDHLDHHEGLWIATGEVSVPLFAGGRRGRGGRAQHLALFVLREAIERLPSGRRWAFLAAGSDGRDGAGAAGALVHDDLSANMEQVRRALEGYASGDLHRIMGTLLEEHPPRTNLTDLYLAWAE